MVVDLVYAGKKYIATLMIGGMVRILLPVKCVIPDLFVSWQKLGKQSVRDVQQGPDGLIYVLTEETDGALLVIEPVEN